MAGRLIADNCNVGPLQGIILEFTWTAQESHEKPQD